MALDLYAADGDDDGEDCSCSTGLFFVRSVRSIICFFFSRFTSLLNLLNWSSVKGVSLLRGGGVETRPWA